MGHFVRVFTPLLFVLGGFLLLGALFHAWGQGGLPMMDRSYTASWVMFWGSCITFSAASGMVAWWDE